MNTKHLLLSIIIFLGLQSCKKDLDEVQPIDVSFQLTVDQNEVWFTVPYEEAVISLRNNTNNSTYTLESDAQGLIALTSVVPGSYTINVSLTITSQEYQTLTGTPREGDLILVYTIDNLPLYANQTVPIQLESTEILGGFVIKQIYYAGSHTTQAANIRDQFIEIYNNSSETLYADSLLIAIIYGKTGTGTDDYSLSNNQYDWSLSIDMTTTGDANTDYIYTQALFMIPSDGTGTRYPVASGESIVIAQTAVNHSGSYVNNTGNIIGAQRPELTVDLSNADFEVWLYPYEQSILPGRTMFANDVDNIDVPNVDVFFATGMRDMILNPQGRHSYAILKVDNTVDLNNLPAYALPTVRTITESTTKYPQLPARFILDAVEIEAPVSADIRPRRLPIRFDSGAASVPGGPFSSQSVLRKTQVVLNGRRILQDTNNSTNDFTHLGVANPYKNNNSFTN